MSKTIEEPYKVNGRARCLSWFYDELVKSWSIAGQCCQHIDLLDELLSCDRSIDASSAGQFCPANCHPGANHRQMYGDNGANAGQIWLYFGKMMVKLRCFSVLFRSDRPQRARKTAKNHVKNGANSGKSETKRVKICQKQAHKGQKMTHNPTLVCFWFNSDNIACGAGWIGRQRS